MRAAVAEARRVADLLHGQDSARDRASPQGPAWPVEPGSLSEAVYWYRQARRARKRHCARRRRPPR